MRTDFLCISLLRIASGPRVKLAGRKSAFTPPAVYSTDRSKTVVPVLVLFFVASLLILRGGLFWACLVLFCFCVFQSFKHYDYLTWVERANLSAFSTFVRVALVWFCLFPLPLRIREGLRLVIVALPGLFSYLCFIYTKNQLYIFPIVGFCFLQDTRNEKPDLFVRLPYMNNHYMWRKNVSLLFSYAFLLRNFYTSTLT